MRANGIGPAAKAARTFASRKSSLGLGFGMLGSVCRTGVIALLFASSTSILQAQTGAITGIVRSSRGPIANARVVLDSVLEVRADTTGRFRFDKVRAGDHLVEAMALGASPAAMQVRVVADSTISANFTLEQVADLDPVKIEANSGPAEMKRAYEDRKRLGLGKFLDSTQIHGFVDLITAASFAGPGVKLNRNQLTVGPYPGCYPEIWIDGTDWGTDQSILKATAPSDVLGMEVYVRNVPVEYKSRKNQCGALLLWTRRFWPGSH